MKKIVEVRNIRIGEGIPKICVSVTGKSLEELSQQVAEIQSYPAGTIDLIEWRLDWYEGIDQDERILDAAAQLRRQLGNMPLLATIRTEEEGGQVSISGKRYRAVNRLLAGSGLVDMIDVQVFCFDGGMSEEPEAGEQNVAQMIVSGQAAAHVAELQATGVRVVGSWHNFDRTPNDAELENRLLHMRETGVDICKIAVMPIRVADVKRLMAVTRKLRDQTDCPLITMSMSGLGVASRITGERFGSAVTFGSVGQGSAPGQVPVQELRRLLEAIHAGQKLVLIGFMGSGKTTIGSTLAAGLGCPMYDTDQLIEEEEGMTISKLFAAKGEAYFRSRETAVLKTLKEREGLAVVSTGGGLPMTEANHEPMKALGMVVLLQVGRNTVLNRLKGDTTRPLLAGPDPAGKVDELLAVRTPVYEKAADLILVMDA